MENPAEDLSSSTSLIIPPPAIDYLVIETELSGCGRWAFGNWDILVNRYTKGAIRAWVKTSWVYRQQRLERTDTYNLEPTQRLNLGCDVWRPDLEPMQNFDRSIIRAIYL